MANTAEKTFADLGPVKHSWSAIVKHDYVAFTPALMYWGTTLDRDMVRDFAATLDRSTRILACDAPMPIFNMANPIIELVVNCGGVTGEKREKIDLSRRLYFAPKSVWPSLRDYLTSYGTIDKDSARFSLAVECPLMTIPDYMRLAEGYMPPGFIDVASVGVYASDYCAIWRWNANNYFDKPTATRVNPVEVVYSDGLMFMKSF